MDSWVHTCFESACRSGALICTMIFGAPLLEGSMHELMGTRSFWVCLPHKPLELRSCALFAALCASCIHLDSMCLHSPMQHVFALTCVQHVCA